MIPTHEAVRKCAVRYYDFDTKDTELINFISEIIHGCNVGMPINKLNRWLGYVQDILIDRGFTTVDEERDFSCPLFYPLDYPDA